MIKLFVSSKCPDCPPAIDAFKKSNLNYEIIDITESMVNLKAYLKLRDFEPYFGVAKLNNKVGIPLIQKEDGSLLPYTADLNLEEL